MRYLFRCLFVVFVAACGSTSSGEPLILQDVHCVRESEPLPPERWEGQIAAYEAADAADRPIYYISIKPSPRRWALWEEMLRANELIEARTTTNSALHFIDVSEAMLDEQGQPIGDLYSTDGLHMSDAGYELWTSIIQPRLVTDLGFL